MLRSRARHFLKRLSRAAHERPFFLSHSYPPWWGQSLLDRDCLYSGKNSHYTPGMKCRRGILVKGTRVPCSQCMPCRINKGRKWSSRIMMEWLEHTNAAWFVTLTYRPEDLPDNASLEKAKFLQWLKDTQKRETGSFRYYAVGEYGDRSARPHYHLAVFLEHPAQYHALQAAWKKGFSQFSEINPARARYLANYTAKKLTKTGDERLAGREPEFRTSSRNPPLGAAFVERLGKSRQAKIIVEQTGDVPRTYRYAGNIYPIGDWAVDKLRTALDVPKLVQARRDANPNYEKYYGEESAAWEPEKADQLRRHIDAKKKQGSFRGKGSKV